MKTTIKRLRTKMTVDQLAAKVIDLRHKGRSAWAEGDGDVNILCVRMEVVQAVPSVHRAAYLCN